MWASRGEGEKTYKVIACRMPIAPVRLFKNVDTGEEKVELNFFRKGHWESLITDRASIASTQKIIDLSNRGIHVTSQTARLLVEYLQDIIVMSEDTLPYEPSRSALGWAEYNGKNIFLPYAKEITFDDEGAFYEMFSYIHKEGDFEEWKRYIGELRSYNIAIRMAMAASFASPLVEIIGQNPFVFHIWGSTGTGKTVSLLIAMSIWGDPDRGHLVRTLNSTNNAMMKTAAFLRNIPFAGDELQTIKTRENNYDKIIMQLTEGIDRSRLNAKSKLDPTKSWACSFLFSGEEPCVKSASGGGAKNRAIEVHCPEKIVPHGNPEAEFCKHNFGHAGEPFVAYIADHVQEAREIYSKFFSDIMESVNTTEKQAGSMALMLTGDEIARRLFWPSEPALGVQQVREYLCLAEEVDVAERAYKYILDKIAEHEDNFSGDSYVNWGKIDAENNVFFIKNALENVLNEGNFDFDSVKNKWADKGYIAKQDERFTWVTRIKNTVARTIRFNSAHFPSEKVQDLEDEIPF